MKTENADSNRLVLERLSILLEKRNTFHKEFLKGIAEGEIIERPYRSLISPPGMPEKWSDNNNEFEYEIRINPDNYVARMLNRNYHKDFNNDFDEVKDELTKLKKNPNKGIARVTIKPKVDNSTFLIVIEKIIRSRKMGNNVFVSEYLDGFSKGTWKMNQIEEPKMSLPPLYGTQGIQTTPIEPKYELFIELPFDNYIYKANDDFDNDDSFILEVAIEIKHFNYDIDRVIVKSL